MLEEHRCAIKLVIDEDENIWKLKSSKFQEALKSKKSEAAGTHSSFHHLNKRSRALHGLNL